MGTRERLSAAQARRTALAATGFGRPRGAAIGRQRLRGLVDRLGVLQIDSVNVVQRAHYMPAYSRLGAYPTVALDRLAWREHAPVEYWAHEASMIPVRLWPLMRWRMERMRGMGGWGRAQRLHRERPGYVEDVLAQVRERGPLSVRDLDDPGRGAGSWWGWSDGKVALEELFASGEVTVAERVNFERRYDFPDRVLPPEVCAAPAVSREDAQRALLRIAAAALGVATADDLADYYRVRPGEAGPLLADLVSSGELLPVEVEGWARPAYLWHEARFPRRIEAAALLSPFDPVVWHRPRAERLFGFHYRIEIYVPAERRVHGYYVLPFLLGDRLVARVDLKADRKRRRLLVPACHAEPDAPPETGDALAAELSSLASWLGLDSVEIAANGDLGTALAG